jgi:hypothetical protein
MRCRSKVSAWVAPEGQISPVDSLPACSPAPEVPGHLAGPLRTKHHAAPEVPRHGADAGFDTPANMVLRSQLRRVWGIHPLPRRTFEPFLKPP